MSNVKFLWDNRRFDAATLTASSELATLPVANLQNPMRRKPWRTDDTGAAHVDIDLSGPATMTALGLVEHDLFSAATLTVRAYDDAFVTEIFSRTFAVFESIIGWGYGNWGSVNFGGLPDASVLESLPRITNTFFFDDVTVNARYWRVEIDNAGAAFSIGRLFLCDYWEPDINFPYSWKIALEDPSSTDTSLGGQKWTDIKERYYRVNFDLDHLSEAETFGAFLRVVKHAGIGRDIILCLSDQAGYLRYYTSMYGRFTSIPELTNGSFSRYQTSLAFEESL